MDFTFIIMGVVLVSFTIFALVKRRSSHNQTHGTGASTKGDTIWVCPKCGGTDSYISQRPENVRGAFMSTRTKYRPRAVCKVDDEIMIQQKLQGGL